MKRVKWTLSCLSHNVLISYPTYPILYIATGPRYPEVSESRYCVSLLFDRSEIWQVSLSRCFRDVQFQRHYSNPIPNFHIR